MKRVHSRPASQRLAAESATGNVANPIEISLYGKSNAKDLEQQRIDELRDVYDISYHKSLWSSIAPELKAWYSGSEARAWFDSAINFYLGQVKAGNADLVIAESRQDGRLLGALFIMKGNAFIENSDSDLRSAFIEKLKKAGAAPDTTLYGAEMFTSPSASECGVTRRAVMVSMFNQYRDRVSETFTHDLIWTLDVSSNPMIDVAKTLGFRVVPGSAAEKGVDLGLRENGEFGYVVAREGPAIYLLCALRDSKRRTECLDIPR